MEVGHCSAFVTFLRLEVVKWQGWLLDPGEYTICVISGYVHYNDTLPVYLYVKVSWSGQGSEVLSIPGFPTS